MKYKIIPRLMNVGVFTGDSDSSDQEMFVVEQERFKQLCESLIRPCLA